MQKEWKLIFVMIHACALDICEANELLSPLSGSLLIIVKKLVFVFENKNAQ